MKKIYSGFILPITMIMIASMTVLTLSLMQSIFIYLKLIHQIEKKHDNFYALEATAIRLANAMDHPGRSECTMNLMDPNQMIEMLERHQGCRYTHKNRHYEYLMDDLGIFPCLKIISNHTRYSSHHWLISVVTSSNASVLQLRIAKPYKDISCDGRDEHLINPGVISWRHL